MQTKNYLKQLLQKHINGTIAPLEQKELYELLDKGDQEADWKAVLTEMSLESKHELPYNEGEWEPMIQSILDKSKEEKEIETLAPVKRLNPWRRIAAAVAVLLILSVTGYLILKPKDTAPIAKTTIPQDIKAPQTNRATITLASGEKVYLDSSANGTLATQGEVKLVKNEKGEIVYSGTSTEMVYNTLTNPRCSKAITLTLSDGSQVWLNAESTLKYPVAFTGNERKVEITGEAYFEVVHNSKMPFKVAVGKELVEDLGTHFNISAYGEEPVMKTTLIEGAIKLRDVRMKPGEQASVKDGKIAVIKDVDLEDVLAWKNGKFHYNSMDLETILRQAARWYDVDIEYRGRINETFSGGISRNVNASEFLKILEYSKKVSFEIEGRKIIVTPAK